MVTGPSSTAGGRRVPDWLVTAAAIAGRLLVVGLAVLAVAVLARQLTVVLVPVLVALLLAGVLAPVVGRLPRRGPSWLAPLLVVLVVLGVVVGLFAAVGIRLSEELPMLRSEAQGSLDRLSDRFGVEVPSLLGSAGDQGGGTGGLDQAAGALQLGARLLFGFFLTLALAFLFLKDGRALWSWVLDKVGPGARDEVDAVGRAAWSTTGAYVRGLTIVAMFDAAATAVGLLVLGVPLVLTLATLQLVLSYVPTFGAVVAGGAAVLVAYATGGLTTAALTLVLVVAVQQIGNDVIEPWVMGRSVGLHPAVVLVAVAAGGVVWGIAGAFLFVPLVAALSAAGGALWSRRHPDPGPAAS